MSLSVHKREWDWVSPLECAGSDRLHRHGTSGWGVRGIVQHSQLTSDQTPNETCAEKT